MSLLLREQLILKKKKNIVIGREPAGGRFEKQFYKIIFNQQLYFLSMDVTEFGGK